MRFPSQQLPHMFTVLAVLSTASTVQAQQQIGPASSDKTEPATPATSTVVVTGNAGMYDPRRDDTAAKVVVNNEELIRYGDASIVDALKRVPGVTVFSTGHGADIRLRGLGSGYTQILVNGEPAPVGFSIDSLDPAQVERLEVIRSAIAEYSTESVAGTINIVLKKIAKKAQHQVQIGYGGDATERTPRAVFLISDQDGKFSYSLSANSRISWFNRNPLIEDTNTSISNATDLDQKTTSHEIGRFSFSNLIPRLTWKLDNGDTISSESTISYTKFDFGADRQTSAIVGPPPADPGLNWRIQTRTVAANSDITWSSHPWPDTKIEINVGIQASNSDNESNRTLFDQLANSSSDTQDFSAKQTGYNTSGKLAKKITDSHQLTSGWEASRIRGNEAAQEIDSGGQSSSTQLYQNTNATVLRAAGFVQDDWTLSSNWSIYLGARLEHLATDVEADAAASHVSANIWSPIAQTLFKLPNFQNDQVRLALTRTFKAPEFSSLLPQRHRVEVNSATNFDYEGNPLLRPEIASGIDVTYEHYFSKTALISIGASNRNIQDYTLTLVSLGNDGRWVSQPVNAGDARTRGLELEAKFPLTLLRAEWPAVELHSSLSRNWSSVDQVPGPNNRVAQQVPLQALLSADYSFGALTTGSSYIFRRGAWTTVTAAQSTLTVDRRDLDLYALWKLKQNQKIRITLGNLLKADDITANRFINEQGILTRTARTPGHVSVRALFEQDF